ncbi:ChrR family anti-sigma-E factor [Yoonia sediminilitoris]|uniref:ChrR-like anti-ECFsigma factor n=1 Tax=Yoonia sediminilitoris TaxID=1286148 RepID=A0A2T6KMZ8_9RHOB|nr:ChrR family anti-sigma-E factor [Yoonia sediminilitoris]PUB17600.1 ChrR-like anti-ECFsigma factor [Yoonia sediminilitoris]RCW97895.1 ChrR-like anti-ECFsigma factor [Yoonia sediminilitoris]
MTQIKHHLSDALLMGYAAGSLPEAFNLVVATHISMCDECRAALAEYDAIGGEVMLDADPIDVAEESLAATMALIESGAVDATRAPKPVSSGIFPAPLAEYVQGDVDSLKWRKVGGGVSQMILPTSSDASVRLLRIPAGTAVPDHGHHGTELTLVLQGAFRDEEDRFGAGDVEVANEDLHHTPIAEEGVDCICLAASDAPLKFKGVLPRIAQRFMRI